MRVYSLYLIAAVFSFLSVTQHVRAADLGIFKGAVWRFTLEPKNKQLDKLNGGFRVHNGVLYQRDNPRDSKSKGHVVGTETLVKKRGPKGAKRTRLNFTDLRAVSMKKNFKGERSPQTGIKGSVFIQKNKFGKWSGIFIAADGRHWKFNCTRIRE